MNKEFSMTNMSHQAWQIFTKNKWDWVMLAIVGTVMMFLLVVADVYIPEYQDLFVLLLWYPGGVYTAILHQNGLDAAYDRKLSMIQIKSSILFSALFFIIISQYHIVPQYHTFLLLIFSQEFVLLQILNWLLHIALSYVLIRCMFVGMILLEEKCSVVDAFRKSLQMTVNQVLLLAGVFIYLNLAVALSALTIIGYFIVFPYTIIMKSLLFKHLREIQQ